MKTWFVALIAGISLVAHAGAGTEAYLGIGTRPVDPTLGAQLSLARGMGLVVTEIDDAGPASALLKKNDVLHLLDGQKLINHAQLRVLIAAQKAGDEIKLGVYRGGKPVVVEAVLAERPAHLGSGIPVAPGAGFSFPSHGDESMRRLQEALEEMRAAQGNVQSFHFRVPQGGGAGGLRVVPPNGASGSAPQVQQSFASSSKVQISKDGYTVTVEEENGQRSARVVDENDTVIFEGPINTEKELAEVPEKARKIIDGISMKTNPSGPVL